MKQYYQYLTLGLYLMLLLGCVSDKVSDTSSTLAEIEAFTLCESSEQSVKLENKLRAEYGFKRFAKNTYRPVIEQRLFGHKIRIIEFSEDVNKVYVSGDPIELSYSLKYLLPEMTCEKNTCQAPLKDGQSLLVYKAESKKSKDTTVIECTKLFIEESEI